MDDHWSLRLLGRAGLTACIFFAVGLIAFWRSTNQQPGLHNLWLMLSAVLLSTGFLWQAGSNWRGQTDEQPVMRRLASIYFGFLVFWAMIWVFAVWFFLIMSLQ
jgi:hypothetical protein